jgi:tripartite-type tricarboxylate transporter receptor subunit TctC
MLARRAAAQAPFPSRAVRIIVPFAAGGPTDIMARGVSQKLGEALGQSVLVDNRPGGGAQIAAAALKQSPPDGHALFIGDIGALAINVSLYQNLSYDPLKDFQPLTLLMSAPIVLLVRTDSPIKGLREMIAMTKSGRPLTMASQGVGTGGHLALEMLKSVAGIEIAHVPYKGSAPAMQDVIGGQVDALFDVLPSALPQAQAGKIRIIAIGSGKRVGAFPDVPTTAELGLGEVSMDVWFAAVAPAGSPDAAVRRLSAELGRAIRDPAVNKRFVDVGWNVDPGTPEQLGALMKSEIERWGAVVRRSGAKAD